jgi:hypothetical protein
LWPTAELLFALGSEFRPLTTRSVKVLTLRSWAALWFITTKVLAIVELRLKAATVLTHLRSGGETFVALTTRFEAPVFIPGSRPLRPVTFAEVFAALFPAVALRAHRPTVILRGAEVAFFGLGGLGLGFRVFAGGLRGFLLGGVGTHCHQAGRGQNETKAVFHVSESVRFFVFQTL